MCWSGEASTALAVMGLSATAYAAIRKEPTALWVTLGYFALMEALQAYTYTVIDQCTVSGNQVATVLGYLHICFQPFFGNALAMHFIPKERQQIAQWVVYPLCAVYAVTGLLALYPFEWAESCKVGGLLCGATLCSISGAWHIGWVLPLNGMVDMLPTIPWYGNMVGYAFVMFLVPLCYGAWRMTLYHVVMGPTLARILTPDATYAYEYPAVWCLLSIGFLLIVVKTPVRRVLYQSGATIA